MPGLPDPMATTARMENPERMGSTVLMLRPKTPLPNGASTARPDRQDLPETLDLKVRMETPALLAKMAHPATPDKPEAQDHPAQEETPGKPAVQDSPAQPDNSTRFPAHPAHLDNPATKDLPDHQDQTDKTVNPDKPDPKDRLATRATTVKTAKMAKTEKMVMMGLMEMAAVATTAHPHVPLPDIKPTIRTSIKTNRRVPSTISRVFLFYLVFWELKVYVNLEK